jgi:hypothetical protein
LPFLHDDGTEVQPASMKDFMSQGKDRMDKWLLKNEPTNDIERELKESLVSKKMAVLNRQMKELEGITKTDKLNDDIS